MIEIPKIVIPTTTIVVRSVPYPQNVLSLAPLALAPDFVRILRSPDIWKFSGTVRLLCLQDV